MYLAANIRIGADPPWSSDQAEALREGGERERGRATLSPTLSILLNTKLYLYLVRWWKIQNIIIANPEEEIPGVDFALRLDLFLARPLARPPRVSLSSLDEQPGTPASKLCPEATLTISS